MPPAPDRLGDANPIEALRRTGPRLARVAERHELDLLRRRPFKGKWTPCEILGHFVDHEIATASRIQTLRFDAVAWLNSYDQEARVEIQRHNERDPAEFIRRFEFLRRLNLEQYESLTGEEWTRHKPHTRGEGAISLEHLVRRHANHDLHHLDQLARYIETASMSTGGDHK